nr:hypothetical protein [Tanacetum cinerariifolium]
MIKPSGSMMCQGMRKEIQTKGIIGDSIHYDALGDMQEFIKMFVGLISRQTMKLARFMDLLNHIILQSKIVDKVDKSIRSWRGRKCIIVVNWCDQKGVSKSVFGSSKSSEEVGVLQNVHLQVGGAIVGEQYNKEYLEKVAKHQRYLASEGGSDLDSPTPKPAKATKKSKPSAPKAVLRPPVIKPASSQQPKPKHAPAKSQEKKLKLVMETSDKPSPAKRSKSGLVTKRRKPTSSLRSVDESVDKGIPEKEPRFDNEEAGIQRVVEESLKSVHDSLRVTLPPVVIREPDSRKFQPLLEVHG